LSAVPWSYEHRDSVLLCQFSLLPFSTPPCLHSRLLWITMSFLLPVTTILQPFMRLSATLHWEDKEKSNGRTGVMGMENHAWLTWLSFIPGCQPSLSLLSIPCHSPTSMLLIFILSVQ
jgi:hypothetical protein